VIVGCHVLWRWHYYGDPLPNTYYAKVGYTVAQLYRGAMYLRDFIVTYGVLLAGLFAVVIVAREQVAELALIVAAYGGFVVLVGGDSFPFFRFFAPVFPLGCLICGHGARLVLDRARSVAAWSLITAGCVAALFPTFFGFHRWRLDHHVWDVEAWSALGEWLEADLGAGESVAANPIGAISFHCSRPVIDMLGITDRHIARCDAEMGKGPAGHEKADGGYVLDRRPRYIFLGVVHPMEAVTDSPRLEPVFSSDVQLLADPDLRRLYEKAVIRVGRRRFTCFRLRKRTADGPDPTVHVTR
jgi:hypothetical protein